MPYDPDEHHRRTIRLHGYDYAEPGAYFVTICVQDKRHVLGDIRDGKAVLNAAGMMVQQTWYGLADHYQEVELDAFVVMPNHIHGIIILTGVQPPENRLSLPDVIHGFKSWTTAQYRRGVRDHGWPSYGWPSCSHRLWQRNYWEHIIRTKRAWRNIRQYIETNPTRWHRDHNTRNAQ